MDYITSLVPFLFPKKKSLRTFHLPLICGRSKFFRVLKVVSLVWTGLSTGVGETFVFLVTRDRLG